MHEILSAFGEFDYDMEHYDNTQWFFFFFSLVLTTTLVLNLTIAIMSDSLAKWHATKEEEMF